MKKPFHKQLFNKSNNGKWEFDDSNDVLTGEIDPKAYYSENDMEKRKPGMKFISPRGYAVTYRYSDHSEWIRPAKSRPREWFRRIFLMDSAVTSTPSKAFLEEQRERMEGLKNPIITRLLRSEGIFCRCKKAATA